MTNTFNPRPLTTEIGELISKIIIFRDYHRNVIRPKNMLEKSRIKGDEEELAESESDPFRFDPDAKWKYQARERITKYNQEIEATKRSNQIYKYTLNIVQLFSFESEGPPDNALQRFFKDPLFDGNVVCLILEFVLDDKINHLYN